MHSEPPVIFLHLLSSVGSTPSVAQRGSSQSSAVHRIASLDRSIVLQFAARVHPGSLLYLPRFNGQLPPRQQNRMPKRARAAPAASTKTTTAQQEAPASLHVFPSLSIFLCFSLLTHAQAQRDRQDETAKDTTSTPLSRTIRKDSTSLLPMLPSKTKPRAPLLLL